MEGAMRLFRIPRPVFRLFPQITWKKAAAQKSVYLTFDDGPDPDFSPGILSILEKHDVTASFFVLGKKAEKHPGLIRQIQKNHVIGIHSYDHQRLVFRSRAYWHDQLSKSKQIVAPIIDRQVQFFRPPYGAFSPGLIKLSRQLNLTPVLWSIMSYDFDERVTDEMILNVVDTKVTNGDIIVFHDGHVNSCRTIRVLEPVIRILKSNGFKLSSLDQ